ncbi:protein of unknown function [Candidatus Methylomirabilis oxygeniifera]|uniref:CARDB domain-containing protein n=1 Tax=Methylomirabilis oxygeniifera TaxID=671143 RepID=D5MG04_METO1|nr:protein of unknown function [Candidatus Methylomirabilis oxyfera]
MWLLPVGVIVGYAPPAWAPPAEVQFIHAQITSTEDETFAPSLSGDGTRIAFVSVYDLIPDSPGNADGNHEIFLWTTGVGFTQITDTAGGASFEPSLSADGTSIAFRSNRDLTPNEPGNADGNWEIFLWTEGSGFTQITNTTGGDNIVGGSNSMPSINANGTRIAFRSSRNQISVGFEDINQEIFLWTEESGLVQITDTIGSASDAPSINADGTRIAFRSTSNLIFPGRPGNADGNYEIFLWTEGSSFIQITNTTGGASFEPSLSADGTRIAFVSNRNLTPDGNQDGNEEIFLWTTGVGFTQITNTAGGISLEPSLSADGTRIAFTSYNDLTPGSPGNADGSEEIFLSTQADTTPALFAFTDAIGVPLSTVQISNAITVTGINAPAAMSIVGGEYEVNGSGIWSSSPNTVSNGNTVRVRHTSAATHGTAVHTTLIIGGVADIFASTTLVGPAVGPDLTGTWDSVGQSWSKGRYTLRGTVRVVNQGTATASASRLRIFLSDDAVLDPGDALLKDSKIKKRKPGQGKTKELKVKLSEGVSAAGKYLLAVVDALNRVAETNEANNTPMIGPIPSPIP